LIDNVRKLQQLLTGGVKTMPVDLGELFQKLDVHNLIPGDRQVDIKIEPVPRYLVEANELLKDVFTNLITNAIKHSDPDQPLTINVTAEPVEEDGQAYFKCAVEDDGPGIPDGLKEKLFHRFQRGATSAHGKGLGLYLVRTLVEGYGGKVRVEDRIPGDYSKGARFVVMLPAARA
jgi:signal transduction histidine kinase